MLIRLVLFFLCIPFLTFAQSLKDIEFGEENTLEIVTWNIEFFPKKGNITIDSVSKIIEALDADIIALQEIWEEDDFNDLMSTLPAFDGFYDPFYLGGLAYIYKENTIEILDVYEIYYTSEYWNALPRAPFIIEFLYEGKKFYCINNHLKCCGDGVLETNDEDDQENRRFKGMNLVKEYIDLVLPNESVFVVGDLNDVLTDPEQNNVFQKFMNDSMNYRFADMEIAEGSSSGWSYPNWPSHLDHILITNELFSAAQSNNSSVSTIQVQDFLQGNYNEYDNKISDHLPVGIKLDSDVVSFTEPSQLDSKTLSIYPNPTYGMIHFDAPQKLHQYQIYNTMGQLVISGNTDVRYIDFTGKLASGIYTIVFPSNTDSAFMSGRFTIVE